MKLKGLNLKIWQVASGCGATWREAFQILTLTLLSLLLPLSFLLLARVSTAHYLLAASGDPLSQPSLNLLSFIFLYSNSAILYSLLSLVSVAAYVHGLTGRIALISQPSIETAFRPRLYTAWVLLCTLHVCVGLGIEGSIAAGIDVSGFNKRETSLLIRAVLFLGLHQTMLFWSTSVVKPVVDDTVLGSVKEARWVQRVTMAMAFGTLWWWRLRDEIDSLVVVAELKREVLGSIGVADFVGWWLYYLTVSIGTIRVLKGVIWVGMITLFRKIEDQQGNDSTHQRQIDDKV